MAMHEMSTTLPPSPLQEELDSMLCLFAAPLVYCVRSVSKRGGMACVTARTPRYGELEIILLCDSFCALGRVQP